MKAIYLLISMALAALTLQAAVADETLLRFGPNEFDDWVYNREDVPITNENISINKITLFTSNAGMQYTLESPVFSSQGIDSLKVELLYRLADDNNYNPTKLAPRIEMLDADRNVVVTVDVPVERGMMMQTLVTTFAVPRLNQATLLFSAPKALEREGNLPAVKIIKVWAVNADGNPQPGDINGDGTVDVADVNIVINLMLGKAIDEVYRGNADVSGDGSIDVGDVNSIINLMLGK